MRAGTTLFVLLAACGDGPHFESVLLPGDAPATGAGAPIEVHVVATRRIASVTLHVGDQNPETFQVVAFEQQEGDGRGGRFTASLPLRPAYAPIYYYLQVVDSAGRLARYPDSAPTDVLRYLRQP